MARIRFETRCLYCSLGCPLAIEEKPRGVVEPVYSTSPEHVSEGRLCYRGHYVAALKTHPRRLTSAMRRGVSLSESGQYGDALSEAAQALREASRSDSLGVLVSGNLPCEQIAAVARFFQTSLPAKNVSVFSPPTDTAMLRGIAAGHATLAAPKDIEAAQVVLAIGDALGTHRVLAHQIMKLRERSRETMLAGIDAMTGCTARFASPSFLATPGAELHATLVMALLAGLDPHEFPGRAPDKNELLRISGLDAAGTRRCVEALQNDPNSLILLTVPPGRCRRVDQLGAAAAALAHATDSRLLPLYLSGNAPGAYAISSALGLTPMAQWFQAAQAGEFSTAFLVDVDLLGAVPNELSSATLGNVSRVIAASPMSNTTTGRADISLPAAFWFECDGVALDQCGAEVPLNALGSRSQSAPSPLELVGRLGERCGASACENGKLDLARAWQQAVATSSVTPEELPPVEDVGDNAFALIASTENLDLCGSDVARQLDWVLSVEPQPFAAFNPADASALGVRDHDVVSLRTDAGTAEITVHVRPTVRSHVIAISPAVAGLFSWVPENDLVQVGPAKASLNAVRAEEH